MPLIKNGEFVSDTWTQVNDDEKLPDQGAVIVDVARWKAEKVLLKARTTAVGVRLNADMALDDICEDLSAIELVVLAFPAFTDGRAYSAARTLRDKYAFEGEIRAVGNVLRDQLAFMVRCGFDAFEVGASVTPTLLQEAISEIDVFYQPASDAEVPAYRLRHS
ncbi:MAG: DUF934 domain-containing protein [Rhodospirillaceae bacterium]|jgi:uncharacterized protein (DUF934 family)|nr:DUF934 domain-containing protein [Rhodospirillaceae bacterium]MBT5667443.1 DUF934 domain-containing protein [Rhodospirillaceae bacterium]MBT5809493.1 DUF934 domain-containing protein [Rhodospirillaceae bacterium]